MFLLPLYSSYGVSVWYPTYVNIITSNEEQVRFDAKCQQNVTEFDITSFRSFCGCNGTVFHDLTISDVRLQSWSVEGAIFSNVTFSNVTFDNVVINSSLFVSKSSFHKCLFNSTKLSQLTWSEVALESTSLSSSVICDLQGADVNLDSPLVVQNTTINGKLFPNETEISNSSILLVDDGANSTCDGELVGMEIECRKPDTFKVYRDSFFVSASALPGNIASAIAVYFLRRNYWLGKCTS